MNVEYLLTTLMVIAGALAILVAALIIWVATLLVQVAELKRKLKRTANWHNNWLEVWRQRF
jgi:hypothetical protein